MKLRIALLLLVLVVSAFAASSVRAVTYGEPDGNGHPNVGAMIAEWRTPGVKEQLCSGTLVSPMVFLTAAHCTAHLESLGISRVWVSFDPDVDPVTSSTKLYEGTMHTNPSYPGPASDPGDIAVINFAKPIKGITPASLPEAGLFDEMAARNGLRGQKFTAVGYGVHETDPSTGSTSFPYDGERWRSVSEFNALEGVWLRLSQNDATGDGGTCYGDSGGPNFLGAGETETDMVASITVTGDAMCRATNDTYRLDTEPARNFLDDFVTLP